MLFYAGVPGENFFFGGGAGPGGLTPNVRIHQYGKFYERRYPFIKSEKFGNGQNLGVCV